MPGPLNRRYKQTLMFCARSGDAFRNDPTLFGDEALQSLFNLVVDIGILAFTESTRAFLS